VRVVLAPDSFKGTIDCFGAAAALAEGWRSARPADDLVLLPLADGGEGTLDVVAAAVPDAWRRIRVVTGPGGAPVEASWLLLPDGTAVVELAQASGLPLLAHPDPLGSHTGGVGGLLAVALDFGVRAIVVALGGSASTDGGTGALRALGARFVDEAGRELPLGGGALRQLSTVDLTGLRPPPRGGVVCLADVRAPLLGPTGAAAVFGPQKGAGPAEIDVLEHGLSRLAYRMGGESEAEGAGAAGGTAYGLMAAWGARIVPGARFVADLVGLSDRLCGADLVITGEGRFDRTSLDGKVVGSVLDAADCPVAVVAGRFDAPVPASVQAIDLGELAGSVAAAQADARRWLVQAGRELGRVSRI
jgi:glycerate kinase